MTLTEYLNDPANYPEWFLPRFEAIFQERSIFLNLTIQNVITGEATNRTIETEVKIGPKSVLLSISDKWEVTILISDQICRHFSGYSIDLRENAIEVSHRGMVHRWSVKGKQLHYKGWTAEKEALCEHCGNLREDRHYIIVKDHRVAGETERMLCSCCFEELQDWLGKDLKI